MEQLLLVGLRFETIFLSSQFGMGASFCFVEGTLISATCFKNRHCLFESNEIIAPCSQGVYIA